jgi:hypothetical protein
VIGAAIVTAAVAAGCGSSGGNSGRWTAARSRAFADAVILKPSDVPGFTASPDSVTAAQRQAVAQLATCASAVDPGRRIVDIHSDDFGRGSGLQTVKVGSSVDVLPSVSLAQQDVVRLEAPRARHCVAAYATSALAQAPSSSVTFGTASVAPLTPPAGTSADSFGYRFVIPVAAGSATFRFYVDLLVHRAGPAEVAFTDLAIGTPFPASDQRRLFSRIVGRAAAQPH